MHLQMSNRSPCISSATKGLPGTSARWHSYWHECCSDRPSSASFLLAEARAVCCICNTTAACSCTTNLQHHRSSQLDQKLGLSFHTPVQNKPLWRFKPDCMARRWAQNDVSPPDLSTYSSKIYIYLAIHFIVCQDNRGKTKEREDFFSSTFLINMYWMQSNY